MKYWLLKSEPTCFSIQHLAESPRQTTCWSGVRNYQARNFMVDMKLGDRILYYHSSTEPPAVVGTAKVVREAYPDHTALDRADDHFDPKATREKPIWQMVDIQLDEIFSHELPLDELRPVEALGKMELLRRGSRLSVQPVTKAEFDAVLKLAHGGGRAKPAAVKPPAKQAKKARPVAKLAAKKAKR